MSEIYSEIYHPSLLPFEDYYVYPTDEITSAIVTVEAPAPLETPALDPPSPLELTDVERQTLLIEAQDGSHQAMERLIIDLRPILIRMAKSFLEPHNRWRAEDFTHDAIVRAMTRIETFTDHSTAGGVLGWYHTILQNRIYDYYRSSQYRREVPTGEFWDGSVNVLSDPRDSWDMVESAPIAAQALRTVVDVLTRRQRDALYYRYYLEMSNKETAEQLGMTPMAIKGLSFRIRESARSLETNGQLTRPDSAKGVPGRT